MIRIAFAVVTLATPAAADQLPPPDYFVTSAFATSTAQAIAVSCSTLSINPVAMSQYTDAVLAALEADGFTQDNLAERMADPSDAIAVLQSDFLERHDLADGASEDRVCAAGRLEIEDGTELGALLTEVEP
ncbi:MAG: DUF5333 family protein [Pseudomonadota bacterium]